MEITQSALLRAGVIFIVLCVTCLATNVQAEDVPDVGETVIVRASYYGGNDGFNGKTTANCTVFCDKGKTAAHRTLPLGTKVKLTNPATDRSEVVTITDRGPYVKGRDLDVAKYGVARPLSVANSTPLQMEVLYIPKEPVMGTKCK